MVPRPTLLFLALAASAIGAPAAQNDNSEAVVDMKVPEQTPEQTAKSNQGHVVVNVFGNPDVEPMCRPNGERCAGGWWCCSGYCDPLRGWRCVSGDAALKEEKGNPPQQQRLNDVEPMCRGNGAACKDNWQCCTAYCAWHGGSNYKCESRPWALEEEKESPSQQQSLDDVEPMCRSNGLRCKFSSTCCSGYCSWHQGYKCVDRSFALKEGVVLREEI